MFGDEVSGKKTRLESWASYQALLKCLDFMIWWDCDVERVLWLLRKEWIERLKLLGRQGVPQSTDFLISFFLKLGTVYFIDGTGQCRAAQASPLLQGVCDENYGG